MGNRILYGETKTTTETFVYKLNSIDGHGFGQELRIVIIFVDKRLKKVEDFSIEKMTVSDLWTVNKAIAEKIDEIVQSYITQDEVDG